MLKESTLPTAARWGCLPPRMRALFITGYHRAAGWLAEAFAADSASDVILEEVAGMAAGLARLRDEVFDAVLVSHEADNLDALELLQALRAGSSEQQPIIVLGEARGKEMNVLCFEVGADAYVCIEQATTRELIWQVARAIERHQLLAENQRLAQEQRHRLQIEHDEATRLLEQQRGLISDLEDICRTEQDTDSPIYIAASTDLVLPERLIDHYQELLKAYVIMGSGNLNDEMLQLAELLATGGVTAQQAMRMHLHVLEDVVRSLGSRSARHVMNRADLLILEVMIQLCEGYRIRLHQEIHPPRQRTLPGFGPPP